MTEPRPTQPQSALPKSELPPKELLGNFVAFADALRRLGIDCSPTQLETLLHALEHVPLSRRRHFKAAARTSLIQHREHLELFDRLFDLFWHRDAAKPKTEFELGLRLQRLAQKKEQRLARPAPQSPDPSSLPQVEADIHEVILEHSSRELLRRKDFAHLTDAELAQVQRLLERQIVHWPPRRSRRQLARRRGRTVDLRQTLRRSLRHGGEPIELVHRQRKLKPRPLVVLCDISGSMEAYSRIFLQLIYTLRGATEHLEAFVFGTRLTRISRELRHRDINRALSEATAKIVDWGGGTRIGESFHAFNRDWGRRVLRRGAVVMILSDAWDRGDMDVLDRETERIARRCSRLIWLNPLLGSEGFQPVASGIRTVMPYLHDFLPIHNLESVEQLAAHLSGLGA